MERMPAFELKIVDSLSVFHEHREEWNALARQSPNYSPFISHEWLVEWITAFVASHRLNLYMVYDKQDRLVAGLPLLELREKGGGLAFRVLQFTANSHSFRSSVLIDQNGRFEEIFAFLWKALNERHKIDYLKCREFISDDSPVFLALQSSLESQGLTYSLEEVKTPPYLQLEKDWETYFADRRGHFRRNLRRRMRNAEKKIGPIKHIPLNRESGDLEDLLQRGLSLEHSGWKGKQGSSILSNSTTSRFYFRIAEVFKNQGKLFTSCVYFGDLLVAFNLSIVDDGTFYLLKVAYDESYSKFSPGQIMMYYLLQMAYEQGWRRFDFLGPAMDWKLEWTSQTQSQHTLLVYWPTWRGRLLAWQNRHLLPRLRKSDLLTKFKQRIQS